MARLNLTTIEPGDAFLPRLADALLTGALVPGWPGGNDGPLALADAVIYVPTRRAARALRVILAERLGPAGAILPSVRPLGEFDETADLMSGTAGESLSAAPAVPPLTRLMLMAPLVDAWRGRFMACLDGNAVLPVSRADTIWLARDLAALVDSFALAEADPARLAGLVEDRDLAAWWQLTTDFIGIVLDNWPAILAAHGYSDAGSHRIARIDAEVRRLAANPPAGPVIAAGSTGSIPATARLLRVIAGLDRGAVVLPGFDSDMNADLWSTLSAPTDDPAHDPAIPGHPQYGLVKLLRFMGAAPDDVRRLATVPPALDVRRRHLSRALWPTPLTDGWAGNPVKTGAMGAMALIEAANEREEAMAIAVALRETLEDPQARAALVTPDRNLARRVAAEMARFGIAVDDSGGTPLTSTLPGGFLIRLARLATGETVAASDLLALLRHPLFRCGLTPTERDDLVDALDLDVLRGRAGRLDMAGLVHEADRALAAEAARSAPSGRFTAPGAATRLAAISALLSRLSDLLAPAAAPGDCPLSDRVAALGRAAEALAAGPDGDFAPLYADEAGANLADTLREIIASGERFRLAAADLAPVLDALLSGATVKPRPLGAVRLSIWGALEARLQTVDRIVLGGLNEGTWPSSPDTGPFLSRPMMLALGLEPPERGIGLAAHDFEMACGMRDVVLSRARRVAGEQQLPARWLDRIAAYCGKEEINRLREAGREFLDRAARLDAAPRVAPAGRPAPCPPLALRPKTLSVSDAELLRRDAYALHARKILRLKPLDPLIAEYGPAEYGTLVHAVLEDVFRLKTDFRATDASARIAALVDARIEEAGLPPDVALMWRTRLHAHIPGIVMAEVEAAPSIRETRVEISSRPVAIGTTGVTLHGRADRIDITGSGAAILDYKTGSTPGITDARMLDAPQLALEGALWLAGGFNGGTAGEEIADLAFIRLKSNGEYKRESLGTGKGPPPQDIAAMAWDRLIGLITAFNDPQWPYLSRGYPKTGRAAQGDYDHLARLAEWADVGDGGDDGDGDDG